MKTDRIPEVDLACIAPLPTEIKREALRALKNFVPPHTYQPVRKMWDDIFNVRPHHYFHYQTMLWQHIDAGIRSISRSESEVAANISAADGLYKYSQEKSIHGVSRQFTRLSLGRGAICYWSNAVLEIDGNPVVPFLDPRISGGLTPIGMRFAFSVMDLRIRQADIDFRDVHLGIFRLSPPVAGKRAVEVYFDQGVKLFSYGDLQEMVRETYDIWGEVLRERAKEPRSRVRKTPINQMEFTWQAIAPQRKAS